jgi:hypothetical protein
MPSLEIPNRENHKLNQAESPLKSKNRLALVLFLLSLCVYLLTRFIRLPDFPIYFFTDEAIQTQHAVNLVANGFRSPEGIFLPTYLENGGQYNLSLSVYVQVLPALIFGKSIWVTRGVSVLLSLFAVVGISLTLKQVFDQPNWWLGALVLTAIPAWFLHSRTAFETVMMASLYAGFLYFYLLYRQKNPKMLFPALIFGALAFYAYSPGQIILTATGLMLLVADWHYHWQHRRITLPGLGMLAILALPYLRFMLMHRQETLQHLAILNSYWVKPLPIYEKVGNYLLRYLKGLNPFYWFWPNPSLLESLWPNIHLPAWLFSAQHDLARHTMKGYGHIALVAFPFWLAGLVHSIRQFKEPAHRTLLLASLAAPSGAAIVDWGIARGLVFIIPVVILISLGIEQAITWLDSKSAKLNQRNIALIISLVIALFSFWMMGDALRNGPTWYEDYGLAGMQYGGKQVFSRAVEIARADLQTTILISSTWANAPDVLLRYFADDLPNIRMGNINAYGLNYQNLGSDLMFVMTEEDLVYVQDSGKFTDITIEETLPYPDDNAGFYFVRLAYVPNIEDILMEEHAARQILQSENITINDLPVTVQFPLLDMNEIDHVFDGDPTTLARTLEANPMRLILTFQNPIEIHTVKVIIGGTPTRVTVEGFLGSKSQITLTYEVDSAAVNREITLQDDQPFEADRLIIEILNPHDGDIAHVHLWEVIIE